MNQSFSVSHLIEELFNKVEKLNSRLHMLDTVIVTPQYVINALNPLERAIKSLEDKVNNPCDKSWNENVIDMQRNRLINLEHENDILKQRLANYEGQVVNSNLQPMQGGCTL